MSYKPDNSKKTQSDWLQSYIDSSEKQQKLYRRTLIIIIISQIFGGAGLAAGITVGALLAQDMLGTESLAGVPAALFTLGSAGAALFVGVLSQRYGRRLGLVTGFLTGGFGAIGVLISAVTNNVLLLFASLFIYGAGTATNLQARYAGTDLANSGQRGTAVSIAMVSTTFGAVAGPNLADLMGRLAASVGIPVLAGPFMLAAAAYILAGLVFFALLRPDPLIVATAIADVQKTVERNLSDVNSYVSGTDKRGLFVGTVVMVISQIVMVAIMTMTPVYMKGHGYGLSAIGLIIGIHIGGMFLPSLVTGILVDKLGRTKMTIASGATLFTAGILSAAAPADSMLPLTIALALLGLGWNFGLISGTAIIVDAINPSLGAKTQGSVDVLIALGGAAGGALSGLVVAHFSYTMLSLSGGILSLLLIPLGIWFHSSSVD